MYLYVPNYQIEQIDDHFMILDIATRETFEMFLPMSLYHNCFNIYNSKQREYAKSALSNHIEAALANIRIKQNDSRILQSKPPMF